MSVYEYKTQLSFYHTNGGNSLSITGLVGLLQEAASSHADSLGFGINNIDKTHLTWLLLSWKFNLLNKPKWNSTITVKTWPRKFAKIYSYRDFEVYDEDSNLVAIATSKWVLINTDTHCISKITPEMAAKYGETDKSVFSNFTDVKLQEPVESTLTFEYAVGKRDIDINKHVNNLCYLDFALEALPKNFYASCFNDVEIFYKKEIKLGEKIKCFYSNIDNKHIVTIKSEDLAVLHSIVSLS